MGLDRRLGSLTTICVGLGVAIGSGIFRTPGLVAERLPSAPLVLLAWLVGGAFALGASLVTAELATRCPQAGGEYVYLRAAYGDGVAFFFGWGYTIFIAGGGVAVVASALGEAISSAAGVARPALFSGLLVVALAAVNCAGLLAGATLQNVLGVAKVFGLAVLAAVGLASGTEPFWGSLPATRAQPLALAFVAALPPVLWSFEGATDSAKLAEEIEDVDRKLPRALVTSSLVLTAIYAAFNLACLGVLGPKDLAASSFPAEALVENTLGGAGPRLLSALVIVTLAGAVSSSLLSTSRVTFALARDGLAPRVLARVSRAQAPIPALIAIASLALLFTQLRGFREGLGVYFLASAVLFGLSYGSLFVFRARDAREAPRSGVFRCPAGRGVSAALILIQLAVAASIAVEDPRGAVGTAAVLVVAGLAYRWWIQPHGPR
ncbi:MAG: APC family permease [Deltaproteobacteria bacterium]|nr:APC family permease [Deltaproteobacteria bacterium]